MLNFNSAEADPRMLLTTSMHAYHFHAPENDGVRTVLHSDWPAYSRACGVHMHARSLAMASDWPCCGTPIAITLGSRLPSPCLKSECKSFAAAVAAYLKLLPGQ